METKSSDSSSGSTFSSTDNSNQDDKLDKGRIEQDTDKYQGGTVPNSYVSNTTNSQYHHSSDEKGSTSSQDRTSTEVMESIKTLKSPYIALFLSFLFTGIGQIYNRKIIQGVALFIVVWGLIFFSLNINLFTLNLVPDFILNIFPLFTKVVLVPVSIYYVWKTPKLTSLFDRKLFTVLLLLSYVIKLQTLLNPIAFTIWFMSIISAFINSPHKFEKLNTEPKTERTD